MCTNDLRKLFIKNLEFLLYIDVLILDLIDIHSNLIQYLVARIALADIRAPKMVVKIIKN